MVVPTGNTFDKYGSGNPIVRRLMTGFFRSLEQALPERTPASVIEVGVGEGEVAERLRSRWGSATIVGLDLPDSDLAAHWSARSIPACFGDALRLPFRTASADLVMAIEVLEHVWDPEAALAEISRVSRDRVVLSVPNEPIWRVANLARGKYVTSLGNTPGHVQHWSTNRFVDLVSRRFDIVSVQRPFPWTVVGARVRA